MPNAGPIYSPTAGAKQLLRGCGKQLSAALRKASSQRFARLIEPAVLTPHISYRAIVGKAVGAGKSCRAGFDNKMSLKISTYQQVHAFTDWCVDRIVYITRISVTAIFAFILCLASSISLQAQEWVQNLSIPYDINYDRRIEIPDTCVIGYFQNDNSKYLIECNLSADGSSKDRSFHDLKDGRRTTHISSQTTDLSCYNGIFYQLKILGEYFVNTYQSYSMNMKILSGGYNGIPSITSNINGTLIADGKIAKIDAGFNRTDGLDLVECSIVISIQ